MQHERQRTDRRRRKRICGIKGKEQTEEEKGYGASKVRNRQKKKKDMQQG